MLPKTSSKIVSLRKSPSEIMSSCNNSIIDYEDTSSLRNILKDCCCEAINWRAPNLDKATSHPEDVDAEIKRLEVLRSYRLLETGTGKNPSFERLTALATRIFNVPICLVSLVDLGRQWFASNRGLGDVRETPRDLAFCAHAVLSKKDLFIVPDATKDARFKDNPLVTGPPDIRFYAGVPLIVPEGVAIGTFCIIDTVPHPDGLDLVQKQNLREIASMIVDQIVQGRKEIVQIEKDKGRLIACTAHDLLTPLTSLESSMRQLSDDKNFKSCAGKHQLDMMNNARECASMMTEMCKKAVVQFRGGENQSSENPGPRDVAGDERGVVVIGKLLEAVNHVMSTYPKKVPLTFHVNDNVPAVIQSDELSLFRCVLNILTNACDVTEFGSIDLYLRMSTNEDEMPVLIFECVDTGPGVQIQHYAALFTADDGLKVSNGCDYGGFGLGLYSVAQLVGDLGGDYGYRANRSRDRKIDGQYCEEENVGSVFWFSVPICSPENAKSPPVTAISDNESSPILAPQQKDVQCVVSNDEVMIDMESMRIDEKYEIVKSLSSDNLTNEKDDQPGMRSDMVESLSRDNLMTEREEDLPNEVTASEESLTNEIDDKIAEISSSLRDLFDSDIQDDKRQKCALVIDDSKVTRMMIQRALTPLGYEVRHAKDGLCGMTEMKSTLFDLVFCDFLMPFMDGIDCVQQYREWETAHRPYFQQYIVGISAHADEKERARGTEAGMNKFMEKPLPVKDVRKCVLFSDEVRSRSSALDELCRSNDEAAAYCLFKDESSVQCGGSVASLMSCDFQMRACLVVEDELSISKAMARYVEKQDWNACVAADGQEALRLLKMRDWDAVFIADQIPMLRGTALVEKFRVWETKNRVVRQNHICLLSAKYSSSNTGENALIPPGFDACIEKPYKQFELVKYLHSVIADERKHVLVSRPTSVPPVFDLVFRAPLKIWEFNRNPQGASVVERRSPSLIDKNCGPVKEETIQLYAPRRKRPSRWQRKC